MEAEITLSYENEREAEAVAKAVSPDNIEAPSGLSIKTMKRATEVFTTIRCNTKLQTFIATLDDLLSCVSVAEKASWVAKELKKRRSDSAARECIS